MSPHDVPPRPTRCQHSLPGNFPRGPCCQHLGPAESLGAPQGSGCPCPSRPGITAPGWAAGPQWGTVQSSGELGLGQHEASAPRHGIGLPVGESGKEQEREESTQVSETVKLVLISSLPQENPQRSKQWFITFLLLQDKETINQNQSASSWMLAFPSEGLSLGFFVRSVACFSLWS